MLEPPNSQTDSDFTDKFEYSTLCTPGRTRRGVHEARAAVAAAARTAPRRRRGTPPDRGPYGAPGRLVMSESSEFRVRIDPSRPSRSFFYPRRPSQAQTKVRIAPLPLTSTSAGAGAASESNRPTQQKHPSHDDPGPRQGKPAI